MKSIIAPLIFLTSTATAFASINHKKYDQAVTEIAALEKTSQVRVAALKASVLATQIADQANFDEIVESIDRTFRTKQKEVITSEYNAGAGFKILFGLLGASAHMGWDTAKIMTTNPEDVAAFSSIKARDFKKLQSKLESYMKKNETELFYSKVFAAKALELASKLPIGDAQQVYPVAMKSAQKVSNVSFFGFQNITNCVRVDYAEREKGWGLKLSGLISFNIGEKETQRAHRETSCSSEAIEHSLAELALNSVDLMLADELLREMNQELQLKIVREAEAPVYPTWGNPSFTR